MTAPDPSKIVIDENGDLMLSLYQILRKDDETETFIGVNGKKIRGTIVATMKVSRQVLMDNSQPFKVEFTGKRWSETFASTIEMEADSVNSIEVVMRVLHGIMHDKGNLYEISIPDVWEVIQYCDYREIEVSKLNGWFTRWIEKKNLKEIEDDDMVQLLYPCYIFDHAKGFATMTRRLAYEVSDHITEYNPTEYRHLHLDGNVIGSLNGAKGSLRSKLLRGLFNPVGGYLTQHCDCKEKSLFAYNLALSKTGIWPLHEHYKKSVQDVLDSKGFANWQAKIPEGACSTCRSKLTSTEVQKVRDNITNDFHGLCLDCMKMTKSGDIDADYWEHDLRKAWSSGCRITHSQPTWYFSFMGRKSDMNKHKAQKKANYEARNGFYDSRYF